MKSAQSVLFITCACAVASGQTATVVTTVGGGSSATIEPAGRVRVAVRVGHSGFGIARMVGDSKITDDAGVGTNFHSSLPDEPTIVLGAFSGGSRVGGDIMFLPPWGVTPAVGNPLAIWEYDVSGLAPGVYAVGWQPDPAFPNVRIYQTPSSFNFVEAQTTYVGATITVVPGPGAAACIALGLGFPLRPRRRATR